MHTICVFALPSTHTSLYRVTFVQMITSDAGISAQSVLVKDVNVVTTSGRSTCVEFNMNVFASGKLALQTERYGQYTNFKLSLN